MRVVAESKSPFCGKQAKLFSVRSVQPGENLGNPHNKVRMEEMAINTVLRRMGVRPQKGKDEFDIVDLGRKRTTEAWC